MEDANLNQIDLTQINQEVFDIRIPVNKFFQFITDQNITNKNYVYIHLSITILVQITCFSFFLFSVLVFKPSTFVYANQCYDRTTNAFINCNPDFYSPEYHSCLGNAIDCANKFITYINKISPKSSNISTEYFNYIRNNGKSLNVFYNFSTIDYTDSSEAYKDLRDFIQYPANVLIIALVLASVGEIIFGLISDRVGKRIIIIFLHCFLILCLIGLTISFYLLTKPTILTPYFTFTISIGALIFCIFPLKTQTFTLMIESYPNLGYLNLVNAFIHCTYFVSLFVINVFFKFTESLIYIVYPLLAITIFTLVFYIVYISETPRFYSDKTLYFHKKNVLVRFLMDIETQSKKLKSKDMIQITIKDSVEFEEKNKKSVYGEISLGKTHFEKDKINHNLKKSQFKRNEIHKSKHILESIEVWKNKIKNIKFFEPIEKIFSGSSSLKRIIALITSLTFSISFYGTMFMFEDKIMLRKNITYDIDLGFFFGSLIMQCAIIMVFGLINVFLDLGFFSYLCLIVSAILNFFENNGILDLVNIDAQRGIKELQGNSNSLLYLQSLNFMFLTVVLSKFETFIMEQIPTRYRNTYIGFFKSFSILSLILVHFLQYYFEFKFLFYLLTTISCYFLFWILDFEVKKKEFILQEKIDIFEEKVKTKQDSTKNENFKFQEKKLSEHKSKD